MREVWINHKLVDFENAKQQQKVTPGCALLESENEPRNQNNEMMEAEASVPPPVVINPCSSGSHQCARDSKCIPSTRSPGDYTCKCRSGFSGKYCDQGEETYEKDDKYTEIGIYITNYY